MYAFPHERYEIQGLMLAETPQQIGVGGNDALVGLNEPVLWQFEVSLSDRKRIVPTSLDHANEIVSQVSVLTMVSGCSERELTLREGIAKKELAEAVMVLAWQVSVQPELEANTFNAERLYRPPEDVFDVHTKSGAISVFNFGESQWDEGRKGYFDDLFTHILGGSPEPVQLNGRTAIIVLPSRDYRVTGFRESNSAPLFVSERLLEIEASWVAEKVGSLITERSTTGDQLESMQTRLLPYDKPWGIRKPDLITLL